MVFNVRTTDINKIFCTLPTYDVGKCYLQIESIFNNYDHKRIDIKNHAKLNQNGHEIQELYNISNIEMKVMSRNFIF